MIRRSKLEPAQAALLRLIFPSLLRSHHKRLWNQFRRRSLQVCDVEDLVQESMLALYRSILAHGFPQNLPGTLSTIAARKFWAHVKKKKSAPESIGFSSSAQTPSSAHPDVDRAVDLRKLAQQILTQLPPQHFDVIDKTVLCDLPHHEAAAALGIPEGTLKSRLRVAMARLIELTEAFFPPSQRV